MEIREKTGSKRNLKGKISGYHFYYKRKGVYPFLIKNVTKILIGIGILLGVIFLLQYLIPDMNERLQVFLEGFQTLPVLLLFFASESLLGLLPPDIFIIWAQSFSSPYLMVLVLALLSYGGGVMSYFIGNSLQRIPSFHAYIRRKFLEHYDKIHRWGGVLIVFAALFPLPFSPVCMVAGTVRFPLPAFFTLSIFRLVRFFVYAVVLFQVF